MPRLAARAPAADVALFSVLTEPYGSSSGIGLGGDRRPDGTASAAAVAGGFGVASATAPAEGDTRALRGAEVDEESTAGAADGMPVAVEVVGEAAATGGTEDSMSREGIGFSSFGAERHPTRTTRKRMWRSRTDTIFCKQNAAARRRVAPGIPRLAVDAVSSSVNQRAIV